jgi:hypothetical protein
MNVSLNAAFLAREKARVKTVTVADEVPVKVVVDAVVAVGRTITVTEVVAVIEIATVDLAKMDLVRKHEVTDKREMIVQNQKKKNHRARALASQLSALKEFVRLLKAISPRVRVLPKMQQLLFASIDR